jgi:hypothetical protein
MITLTQYFHQCSSVVDKILATCVDILLQSHQELNSGAGGRMSEDATGYEVDPDFDFDTDTDESEARNIVEDSAVHLGFCSYQSLRREFGLA